MGRVDLASVRRDLQRKGLRATRARLATLAALRGCDSPRSHGEMEALLHERRIDRTTVYRNLLDLVRVGLARRFDVGDRTWRFEAGAAEAEAHPHFVCSQCGDIACLDGVDVAVAANAPPALRARAVEIRVHGVCDRCS